MRLGVLDVGSNSAQLQVMDATVGGPPLPIYAVKEPTRLGRDVGGDGVIREVAAARVVGAVARTVKAARQWNVEQLYPFATAAIRDATNRDEILDRVAAEAGVRLQYLTGEQEARITYAAVRRWYGWQAGRLLNIDIGGGSMELAFGSGLVAEVAISLPLGAGRVTRTFLHERGLPGKARLKALRKHVRSQVSEMVDRIRWEGQPRRVIATSKTFKQLARLCGAPSQRKGPFVRRNLTTRDLSTWVDRLARTPVEERARLRGISVSRAPQILGGAVVALETLRCFDIGEVELCPWALREGIILGHLAALADTSNLPLQPLGVGAVKGDAGATVTPLRGGSR